MKRPQLRRRPSRRLGARDAPYDPYASMPVDELDEPILPRWFVLTLLASIPAAIVVFGLAFFGFGRTEAPVTERRPPPADGLSADVGTVVTGEGEPVAHDPACPAVEGFAVAGATADRDALAASIDALCEVPEAADEVAALAAEEVAVRYASFEVAGVDVASDASTVYLDARHAGVDPVLAAPLLAYEAALRAAPAIDAETVAAARATELTACERLLAEPTRPCADAAALLELDDPVAALREAGFD